MACSSLTVDSKFVVVSNAILFTSKITVQKLTKFRNYQDWSKIVNLYLLSIAKDHHLNDD